MTQSRDLFIVSYARTPWGAFQGALSGIAAPRLGAHAIKAVMERTGLPEATLSKELGQHGEVILGNVLAAGVGQAPARQAALYAGLPDSTPCVTVNKVCGSGMKAIMLAAQSIALGETELAVAGGQESMSQAPYLLQNARGGLRMGNAPFLDSMIHDGLWDPYNNQHMGNCGELCAREKSFTREAQDAFAIDSFKRAQAAQKAGKFKEIAPFKIESKKGDIVVSEDEGPAKVKFEKIPELKPAFDKNGTVTAANASTINDGAAVMLLAGESAVKRLGLKPIARIVASATHSQKPEWFTTAPAGAMKKAMDRAGWSLGQVDLFEVNEAFAVVALAAERELGIPHDKNNIWGGAISLGHPIGASGARIVGTLVQQLRDTGKKRGVAGICIGGGEATAMCVEVL